MAWKIIRIIIGTLMMAAAVNFIFEPMNMVMGGVSGLAIIVKELTKGIVDGGFPVWVTNLAANVPIFLLGYFVMGKSYLGYTFFANLCFSFFLLVFPVSDSRRCFDRRGPWARICCWVFHWGYGFIGQHYPKPPEILSCSRYPFCIGCYCYFYRCIGIWFFYYCLCCGFCFYLF